MLDADAPGARTVRTQCQHVAADVDERVMDAVLLQDGGGTVQRITLGIAAQVELDRAVAAGHHVAADGQIAHLRVRPDQCVYPFPIR